MSARDRMKPGKEPQVGHPWPRVAVAVTLLSCTTGGQLPDHLIKIYP